MKVMYGNRVNVLMIANMLHVRFVGRNCPVHKRRFNICAPETLAFTAPVGVQCTDTNSEFIQTNFLYKRHWN